MNRLLSIFVVGLLLALFVNQSHAHMWLRVPISRGGVGFSGNTNGPCANKPWGSGEITTFQAGQNVTFQFRVNQHGPGPFMFALSRGNEKYTEVLRSGIPNQVTAGPEGFNGVNINIVLPKKTCNNCTIQLSGMSKSDGTKTWYNCADIKIVSSSSLPKVTKLNPVSGPTKGGNKINVIGTGFGSTKNENVKCRFDNVEIDGTWVDKAKISCVVPPRNAPSTAAVEVSLDDGETYSSSGVVYTYLGVPIVPVISSIKPTTVKPGATITITGKYFYASEMVCKFTAGQSSLYVGAQATSETTAVCTVPTGLKGAVSLEVNVDGSDYSDSGSSIQIKTGDEETQESQSAGGKVSPANLVISMGLVFLVALFPSY